MSKKSDYDERMEETLNQLKELKRSHYWLEADQRVKDKPRLIALLIGIPIVLKFLCHEATGSKNVD